VLAANDSNVVRSEEQCTCITQCKMVAYSSSISQSRMSVSDILIRMSDRLYSSAVPAFRAALETAERVKNDDNIQQTVELMLGVLDAHRLLNMMIEFNVTSRHVTADSGTTRDQTRPIPQTTPNCSATPAGLCSSQDPPP